MRLFFLFLLIGCAEEVSQESEESNLSEFVLPTCDKYEDQPGIKGFCLTIWAPHLESADQMEETCSQAGIWEGECRAAWLTSWMDRDWGRSQGIDQLLMLCNNDPLCSLAVLKMRSDPSLEQQIEYCLLHTDGYAETCVTHSIQRWWRGSTEPDPIASLSRIESQAAEQIGWWVAAIGLCQNPPFPQPCNRTEGQTNEHCLRVFESINEDPDICTQMEQSPEALNDLNLQGQPAAAIQSTGTPIGANVPITNGISTPDPRTHGHVPGGTPGGGLYRPPESSSPSSQGLE